MVKLLRIPELLMLMDITMAYMYLRNLCFIAYENDPEITILGHVLVTCLTLEETVDRFLGGQL